MGWKVYTSAGVEKRAQGIPFVSSLPSTPFDGQEIHYLANANGATWHLKYRAGEAGSYKWYFVGGSPLFDTDDEPWQDVKTSAANNTWWVPGDGSDWGLTLPLAGDYEITMGANFQLRPAATAAHCWCEMHGRISYNGVRDDAVGHVIYAVNEQDTVDADYTSSSTDGTKTWKVTVAAANTAIEPVWKHNTTSGTIGQAWMVSSFVSCRPIRVG